MTVSLASCNNTLHKSSAATTCAVYALWRCPSPAVQSAGWWQPLWLPTCLHNTPVTAGTGQAGRLSCAVWHGTWKQSAHPQFASALSEDENDLAARLLDIWTACSHRYCHSPLEVVSQHGCSLIWISWYSTARPVFMLEVCDLEMFIMMRMVVDQHSTQYPPTGHTLSLVRSQRHGKKKKSQMEIDGDKYEHLKTGSW